MYIFALKPSAVCTHLVLQCAERTRQITAWLARVCHAVLCFTLCKLNEKKCMKSEKTGSAIWIADILGWSLGWPVMAGRVPTFAQVPWVSQTQRRSMAACHRSHAHNTQRTGSSRRLPCSALAILPSLWSHQHLKTRQMAESRAESSPALHPVYTGTQPPEGLGRGHSNCSTSLVLRVCRVPHLVMA